MTITTLRDLETAYAAQTIALGGQVDGIDTEEQEEDDYWTSLLEWVDAQA